ncbi:MAG: HAMP domain-containing histidine kinase [Saprospiraceae bacterium]|nr:HAMP domain-containing histidine kinase [Saprospiraceae bacterium]
MQIRTKLALQFIFLAAIIFALALLLIYAQFERHMEKEFYTLLESKARMTADMILRHENELAPLPDAAHTASVVLPHDENTFILNADDRCVFAVIPASVKIDAKWIELIRITGTARLQTGKIHAFGASVNAPSGGKYIVISESTIDDSQLRKLRNILIITFLLTVGMVAWGGYFYAGQALRPVSHIVQEVDNILPSDLSRRLKSDTQKDELSHLAATFNRLLGRIERAFNVQRSFISNVSHELKNPLAAMDAQLQLALQKERPAEDYLKVLESLHNDVHDMSETVEKLLQLAEISAEPSSIAFSKIRLDEAMLQARDALTRIHPEYNIVFEIQDMPTREEHLYIDGNEPLLRSALQNLFDNGCKFSADKKVHVRMRFKDAGQHEVEIQDNGPGIPQEDIQRIFEPFFRSRRHTHVEGSGIGLSLVNSVLKLHGVVIEVISENNNGSVFKLNFPIHRATHTLNTATP